MIKKNSTIRVSCHCGSIQLDVFLLNGLEEILRCNCSICSKSKGYAMICVPLQDVNIISGKESIAEYIFNTTTAPHFFCIVCGIHTHHKSRARPDKLCINFACIHGLNISEYDKQVVNFDGIKHPKDFS